MSDEEKCPGCHKGNLVKIINENGNTIKLFSCGHRNVGISLSEDIQVHDDVSVSKKIVVGINEGVNVSEGLTVSGGLYFELTDSVSVSGMKQNSSKFELIFDEKNTNMLKAFRITGVDLESNVQIGKAFQQAYRFTSFISLKTGMYVFHKRPQKIQNGQLSGTVSFSIGAVLTKLLNLDMTDNELVALLGNDSKDNQQLAHFAAGQRALEDATFSTAIKEFYQVIEHENIQRLEKYKFLRDGLSHDELTYPNTIQKIQDEFNITCIENPTSRLTPKGKYIDITSIDIQNILETEAKSLRVEIMNFLDGRINAQTN
ncbi:MAG: hypothetical protein HRU07_03910 [Nitrosopumilus sp.]|nr:hypothetical protein [Nitrosopumilus sp.]NRA05301.1 hypothetical protein [Nitrosopumilus sp.]